MTAPSPMLVRLLSISAGIGVANLYYAQPLAALMARSLGVTQSTVSGSLMASQIGYALGMLLLVPTGDGRERRSVIVATALSSAPMLLLLAASTNVAMLTASSFLVGVTASVPQMLLPFAVNLVAPEQHAERGRVIGTVMSGLLAGILLSRTVGGALGAWFGWRATFVIAAGVMLLLAGVLRFSLPTQEPAAKLRVSTVLRSMFEVWRTQPVLRQRALVGALGFASFSVFWSTLAFHLEKRGYDSATTGAFGVIGVVGVFVAPLAARGATGAKPSRQNVIALLAVAAAFALFYLGAHSLLLIGVGVVLLDAGVQASHLTNQTVIFGLAPEQRSRLNALYMVTYFCGGALGTALASIAWSRGGWLGVCACGGALALLGMAPLMRRAH